MQHGLLLTFHTSVGPFFTPPQLHTVLSLGLFLSIQIYEYELISSMTNMMGRIIIVKRGATFSTWKITERSLSSWGSLGGEAINFSCSTRTNLSAVGELSGLASEETFSVVFSVVDESSGVAAVLGGVSITAGGDGGGAGTNGVTSGLGSAPRAAPPESTDCPESKIMI